MGGRGVIGRGSRYESAPYVRVPTRQGEARALYAQRRRTELEYDFRWYVLKAGDRFDKLAADAYGDPTKWWIIAEANPEVFYPDSAAPGTAVRIPHAVS